MEDASVGYTAVSREFGVELLHVLQHYIVKFAHRYALAFGILKVGNHESFKFALAGIDDKRLGHVWHIVEFLLNLFGIDILPGGTENHVFVAAAYVEKSIGIEIADVAGCHPAVAESSLGGFRVFVIALHHIVAANPQYAGSNGRIVTVDAQFHTVDTASARLGPRHLPRSIADERSTLSHAVADSIGEVDAAQECLDILVESGTSDNKFVQIAAEHLSETFLDFAQKMVVDKRQMQEHFHHRFVEQGENSCSYDFFDNQRHGHNHFRFDCGEGVHNDFGRRRACQEIDVTTSHKGENKFNHHAVHVCHGQHRDKRIASL